MSKVHLKFENGNRASVMIERGRTSYKVRKVMFYNQEGVKFEKSSYYINLKQTVNKDDLKGVSLKDREISFDVSHWFSKAKVKRKPDFKNNEFFIMENKTEYLLSKEYDLYIPLKVVPHIKKTRELKKEYSSESYYEEEETNLFCANSLKEGLLFEYSVKESKKVFMEKNWVNEKVKYFHDFLPLRKALSEIKHGLLTDTDEEQDNTELLNIAQEIEEIAKFELSFISGNETKGITIKKGQIACYDLITSDYKHERKLERKNYPSQKQFDYHLCNMLEIQLSEIELSYGSNEHKIGKNTVVI